MNRAVVAVAAGLIACRGGKAPAKDASPPPDDAVRASAVAVPETIVLDEVEVRLRGSAETALVGRSLGRDLARCLIDAGRVVPLASQVSTTHAPRSARLQLEVAAQPGAVADECPAPCQRMAVVMDAQLRWTQGDEPAPSAIVSGDATPIDGSVDTAVLAVALRLQEAVCADLGARIAVWAAGDLAPILTGDDPAAALWALQLVAARPPAPGLVDAVSRWLEREPPFRDAAIAALVALRDPRAVPALTAIADVGDRTAIKTIVEAVIAIGGEDARDFLQVLSSHRDPAVADHAREGLERLARRGQ